MRHTCIQCSDEYPWRQTSCTRCGTLNENRPSLVAIRLLAVSLVVMAIAVTMYLVERRAEFSGSGLKPLPGNDEAGNSFSASRKSTSTQDPQFGNL